MGLRQGGSASFRWFFISRFACTDSDNGSQITVALDSNRAHVTCTSSPSTSGGGRAFASSSSSRPVESDMHASPITAAQALQLQGHMQPSSILHAFGIPLRGLDFRCCALGPKNTVIVGSGSPCCRRRQNQKSDTAKPTPTSHCITNIHPSLTWRCCDAMLRPRRPSGSTFPRDPPDSRRGCPCCPKPFSWGKG